MGIEHENLVSYCGYEDVLPLIGRIKAPSFPFLPKSVVVCIFPYYVGEYGSRNVARYAMLNDYHKVGGEILEELADQLRAAFPNEGFKCFIDSSPIAEVRAAKAAGLGVIGRHGMLIHEKYGSRVFIGTIVTSLGLKPKAQANKSCLGCLKCIKACPTGALSEGKSLDAGRCRSHITQKKSALTGWEREEIMRGGLVWGCDICADACPMNKNAEKTPLKAFYDDIVPVLTQENLNAEIEKKPYNWRGETVLSRNMEILSAPVANRH